MSPIKIGRLAALDFTKGALVLIMVLYHWLNYFVGPDLDYRYLRFLTPSFIFITGFLISHVYLSRLTAAPHHVTRRLFVRGLKLLVLFVILNLGTSVVGPVLRGGGADASHLESFDLWRVFVLGPSGTEKSVSFYILVPLSYLLLVSAALVFVYSLYRYVFHVLCALFLCSILLLHFEGLHSSNLEFVTMGILGVVCGFARIDAIQNLAQRYLWLGFAYFWYLMAIAVWGVPFGLLVIGVCLTLLALFHLGSKGAGTAREWVILLGQYSLFGYIAQIAILQVMRVTWRHLSLGQFGIYLWLLGACALTLVAVEIVATARAKSQIVERLYKLAFA